MVRFRKNSFLFFAVLVFFLNSSFSQNLFKSGYIIDLKGDTIFGEIDFRGDKYMGHKCRFVKDGVVKEYLAGEIYAFRFNDSKFFISKNVDDKIYFLEYLIKGKVNIYYLRNKTGDHYYIDNEKERLTEIPFEEEFINVDGKMKVNEAKRYAGVLKYYMQDAKDFDKRLIELKNPGHKNLINIARDYHNQVCKDEKCVVFEKEEPLFRIKMEPTFGLGYINSINVKKNIHYQYGILLRIWTPRVNENTFFRTGVLSAPYQFVDSTVISYFKIPIGLEYVYPKYKIKPKLGYGVSIYRYFYQNIDIMAGMEIPLNKRLDLNITCNTEFVPLQYFLFLPGKYFSNWLSVGLIYNFVEKGKL